MRYKWSYALIVAVFILAFTNSQPSRAGCPKCDAELIKAWTEVDSGESLSRYSNWLRTYSKLTFAQFRQITDKGHSNNGFSADIPVPIAEAVFELGFEMFFNNQQDWSERHSISELFENSSDGGVLVDLRNKWAQKKVGPDALVAYLACIKVCDPLLVEPQTGGDSKEFMVNVEWSPKGGNTQELLITDIAHSGCDIVSPTEAVKISDKPITLSYSSKRPSIIVTFRRHDPAGYCSVGFVTSAGSRSYTIASELKPIAVDPQSESGTKTGISVSKGDRFNVSIHGSWYPGGGLPYVDARGGNPNCLSIAQQDTLLCPKATFATMVAKVGSSVVPIIGGRFIAPEDGEVILLINDTPGTGYGDNRGKVEALCWKDGISAR